MVIALESYVFAVADVSGESNEHDYITVQATDLDEAQEKAEQMAKEEYPQWGKVSIECLESESFSAEEPSDHSEPCYAFFGKDDEEPVRVDSPMTPPPKRGWTVLNTNKAWVLEWIEIQIENSRTWDDKWDAKRAFFQWLREKKIFARYDKGKKWAEAWNEASVVNVPLGATTHIIKDKIYWFAESFSADGYKGISAPKIEILEWYVKKGGKAGDFHDLPTDVQIRLQAGNVHELLYQDVNRWLQDKGYNPHMETPDWLSAESFSADCSLASPCPNCPDDTEHFICSVCGGLGDYADDESNFQDYRMSDREGSSVWVQWALDNDIDVSHRDCTPLRDELEREGYTDEESIVPRPLSKYELNKQKRDYEEWKQSLGGEYKPKKGLLNKIKQLFSADTENKCLVCDEIIQYPREEGEDIFFNKHHMDLNGENFIHKKNCWGIYTSLPSWKDHKQYWMEAESFSAEIAEEKQSEGFILGSVGVIGLFAIGLFAAMKFQNKKKAADKNLSGDGK